ncbi:MAG: tRNA (adenosine(37)-N6)-dimethylallyltransferase MiaA [Ruminococcus sp.]|nr:tRNA (adenosine(37)-N6)-dimethylallyltransferase MiaA [Ruminococcus sp.]
MKKPFVLAVVGPTASGKTAMGIRLAKELDGEIISADSMQIYKGMDIATAKPTADEMQGIPHHLIDFLARNEAFSVADYVSLANEKITDIISRGKLPIIVGGTGLYISSLLDNIKFSESRNDESYRKELTEYAQKYGNEALHARLAEIDKEGAEEIHPNNVVRVIRALEICRFTGKKFSEVKLEGRQTEPKYDSIILGLTYSDRQMLYDRINKRVDIMVENGLVEESRKVWSESGLKTASNAIGYKELIPYFENKASLEECIDKIKQETRHYAKRQLTWFRRNEQIWWILLDEIDKTEKILEKCKKYIANRKKI